MTAQQALVPVRRTARQREERRIRIMGMVRSGFSYEVIARDVSFARADPANRHAVLEDRRPGGPGRSGAGTDGPAGAGAATRRARRRQRETERDQSSTQGSS